MATVIIQSISSVNDIVMIQVNTSQYTTADIVSYNVYMYDVSSGALVRQDTIPRASVINSVIRITNLQQGNYTFRVSLTLSTTGETSLSAMSAPIRQYMKFIANNNVGITIAGGGNILANSTRFPNITNNGLIAYYDFNSPFTYNGTSNIFNLATLQNDASIRGTFTHSNGRLALRNSNASIFNNTASIQMNSLSTIRTISTWVNMSTSQRELYYFLDGREGTGSSYIWQGDAPERNGAVWISPGSALYINGMNTNVSEIPRMSSIIYPVESWTNLTFVASANINDDLTLFARFRNDTGIQCQVGNVMIYNRVLTPQEIRINYNGFLPQFITSNANIASNGLLAYYDFANTFSFFGNSNLYNLVTLQNDATIRGTFTYTRNQIILPNQNSNTGLNNSFIQLNPLSNVRSISMWVNISSFQPGVEGSPAQPTYYMLDARIGTATGWIWEGSAPPNNGAIWTASESALFINGSNASPISLLSDAKYPRDVWTHITFISASNINDDITLFARYSSESGLNCRVGNVLVYNKVLTQQEVTSNYNAFSNIYV